MTWDFIYVNEFTINDLDIVHKKHIAIKKWGVIVEGWTILYDLIIYLPKIKNKKNIKFVSGVSKKCEDKHRDTRFFLY